MRYAGSVNLVRQMHEAYEKPVDLPLDSTTLNDLGLSMTLIAEEFLEVGEAVRAVHNAIYMKKGAATQRRCKANLLKELCDLQYVLDSMFVTFGLPKDAAFKRVHDSNMTKLGDDGRPIRREDGKILKGPNYQPPEMEILIEDTI